MLIRFSSIALFFFFAPFLTLADRIADFAGNGTPGYSGDGGPALDAQLNQPFGVLLAGDGALYICDTANHCIRKVVPDGRIFTVAGVGGHAGYSGDGGPATEALLNEPYEVRFGPDGDLYFVEMKNHLVRRVDQESQTIHTVAGTGEPGFSGDGQLAIHAQMRRPHSIQFGPDGNLYICDIGNHRVRKVDLKTGLISTFAGTGKRSRLIDDSPFKDANLNGPRAIDFDLQGNLWLALREGNAVYEFDLRSGKLYHRAGTGKKGFGGHGGLAVEAPLSGPKGISLDSKGNVYLADTESHSVRMIEKATGKLRLIAGDGKRGDGRTENPQQCRMARLHGVFVDSKNRVFIGDSETHRVRVVLPD